MHTDEFEQLALASLDSAYRMALHLTRRQQEADDLVQETYLRAFRSAASYVPGPNGIRPWLFKILHNVLRTRLTRVQRDRSFAEEIRTAPDLIGGGPRYDAPDAPPAADGAGLAAVNWDGVDERLKDAVHALPLDYRTAFLLSAVEGLKYREIAEVTDVPLGTVMSRLYRARVMLAAQLGALAAERGTSRNAGNVKPAAPAERGSP